MTFPYISKLGLVIKQLDVEIQKIHKLLLKNYKKLIASFRF